MEGSDPEITAQGRQLAPWHFDFKLPNGGSTADFNQATYGERDHQKIHVVPADGLVPLFRRHFPHGLGGKTLLDVGCNAGAYCFMAHEFGADLAVGFDVRQHWIDQAEFIRHIKYPNSSNVHFKVADAKEYLRENPSTFDVTIFKGVFYHLPDPISLLFEIANSTKEMILIDTASSDTIPEDCMRIIYESKTHYMSGVDGIAWLPGGPKVIETMLRYCGFTRFEVPMRQHDTVNKGWGRFRILGWRT